MNPSRNQHHSDPLWMTLAVMVRRCARQLAGSPFVSISSVAILAVAIGLTTTMFAVLDSLLLRPVPFPHADRLARLYLGDERGGSLVVPPAVLRAWRTVPGFGSVEGAVTKTALLQLPGGDLQKTVATVTVGTFQLAGGASPVTGRLLGSGDMDTNRVLISADLWRAYYSSEVSAIGETIVIDGAPSTVVGVLPSTFHFPTWDTEVWKVSDLASEATEKAGTWPVVYVRLENDHTPPEVWRHATLAARDADRKRATLWTKADSLVALGRDPSFEKAAPLLLSATALLFVTLCANVSGLILTSLMRRADSLRMAFILGASRTRVVGESLLSSCLIGGAGLAAGLLVAWWLMALFRSLLADAVRLHSLNPIALDVRALAAASLAAVATVILSGVVPPVIMTGGRLHTSPLTGSRGTASPSYRFVQRALLALQIAISFSLLLWGAVLVNSFVKLAREPRGLTAENILVASVSFPPPSFPQQAERDTAARSIDDRANSIASIETTAWSYGIPPRGGITWRGSFLSDLPGQPATMTADLYLVTSGYFDLYGLRPLSGRLLDPRDAASDVVVSQRFARALWPDTDPLDHTFRFQERQYRVVGVVADTHFPSLDMSLDVPQIYANLPALANTAMLSIRCAQSCPQPLFVGRELERATPGARVQSIRPLAAVYERELARPRVASAVAFTFAATGLVAAATALVSLLSQTVASRRREYGIRMALGAPPGGIRAIVCKEGARFGVPGLVGGGLLALAIQGPVSSMVYRTSLVSWHTALLVLPIVTVVALCSLWIPAAMAVRSDPIGLLRED